MNVLILSGSRNPEGQTAAAAKAFLKGVNEKGGAAELVFLPPLSIERCRQCEDNGPLAHKISDLVIAAVDVDMADAPVAV